MLNMDNKRQNDLQSNSGKMGRGNFVGKPDKYTKLRSACTCDSIQSK